MDRYYMLYQIFQLRQTQEERNSLPQAVQTETNLGNAESSALSMYPGLGPLSEGDAPWLYPIPYQTMSYPVTYELVPMAGFRYGLHP